MQHIKLLFIFCLFFIQNQTTKTSIIFTDVTASSGINFRNQSSVQKNYIVESIGGGVAWIDYDNDGKLDIYLLNSYSVKDALAKTPPPPAALYRNTDNGKFEERAIQAGVANPGWAMGVSVADFDNDGYDDLYITCFGPNKLYRNLGNGNFEDVTSRAGVGNSGFSSGSAWGDYDRDGDLDLFVAGYVDFKLNDLPQFGKGKFCKYRNIEVQCGPRGLPGAPDILYRNNGNGTFTDVSLAAKVSDAEGYYGLGVTWTDFNDDGWPDIYVANDATPNYAYLNNHDGTFTEQGLMLGLAVDENGVEQGSMGIAIDDYDHDLKLDLIVTNFADQYNTVYHKTSDDTYQDVSRKTGTADISLPFVGWGVLFFDYDHDSWSDLLIVNGHVYPQVEGAYPEGKYRQRMLFYRNLSNGTFTEIAKDMGRAMVQPRASRGAAMADYDEDGDIDIIVNNLDGAPTLLRNDGGSKAGNWLMLKLTGAKSNRNAVGARVTVKSGNITQTKEIYAGTSYLSHNDWKLHFGLGSNKVVDEITIKWPSGTVQKLNKVKAGQIVAIKEKI